MKSVLSHGMLSRLSEIVAARTALYFPRERWSDLESKVVTAAGEFGFADAESFIRWLASSPVTREQIELLASHLTISETYFWREPQVFDALVEHILPELARSKEGSGKLLRIWSAGCSTGEEPYSIAIALHRVIPDLEEWNITLLATDINPQILQKANAGIYREWSFRNAPSWLKDGYFLPRDGGRMEILPEIKKMVTFSYLNLAEDIYPLPLNNTGAMDIIFCRNVLMYFTSGRAVQVVQGLYRSLADKGWLMVGASELSQQLFPQFASVNFPDAVVYRKETSGSRPSAVYRCEEILSQQEIDQPSVEPAAENGQPVRPHLYPDNEIIREDWLNEYRDTACEEVPELRVDNDDRNKADKTEGEESQSNVTGLIRELADSGNLSKALALCDTAITADKLDPGLSYLRAVILQELNRYNEAVISLKHTLYLKPDHALAYFSLGNILLRQGDAKSAYRCFENALELLSPYGQEDILPESEGLTAGRLSEIIRVTISMGVLA